MACRLREKLGAGEPAMGAQLRFGSPAIAELFGLVGFDWIVIDAEHAPQTPVGIQTQLQAAEHTGTTCIVRPCRNDPDLIRLYLDMGATGVLVPFVETAADAEAGAKACRYPPSGTRGWGPHRAHDYGLHSAEYTARSNDEVLYIPIIETATAIANIEAMMQVEGVDACMIGPVDLSISLGVPFDYEAPVFRAAVDTVLRACERASKPAGIPAIGGDTPLETLRKNIDRGFRLVLAALDESLVADSAGQILAQLAQ